MTTTNPRSLSYSLKQVFLTDKYGGWENLDPDLLDRLCDRIEEEVLQLVDINHEGCENRIRGLTTEVSLLEHALQKTETDLKRLNRLRP